MDGAPVLGARTSGGRGGGRVQSARRAGQGSVMFSAVDLFCGAGGLTEGLRLAGFRVVGAVDNAPLAVEAYKLNHRGVRVWLRDIRRLAPLEMAAELGLAPGELDLLAGCPPCQGFST